jgi:DNA-binding CsgD family transcriptional regulator
MQWRLVAREDELSRASELLAAGTSVAYVGSAGVGKSRLLGELLGQDSANGRQTLSVAATEASRTIPFGPFAGVVPRADVEDRLGFLGGAIDALSARRGPRGLLIGVDDAHHLDPGSLALLTAALAVDGITACMTARSDESMPVDLVGLWTDGTVERIDIGPFDRERFPVVLEAVLGSCHPDLVDELWRLSQGNALILHEVIEGARGAALVQDDEGIWRQVAPLAMSARLSDLIAARLSRIPDQLRPAMAVVAVGAPLPLALFEEVAGRQVDALDQANLISIRADGDGPVVVPAHPLYGELFREALGFMATREANRALLDGAVRQPSVSDALRAAIWQRDSGTLDHPAIAIAGARAALARHDAELTEQLVRPFASASSEAGILLGRALNMQRKHEEAERVMRSIEPTEASSEAALASARAHNLAFGLAQPLRATRILADAAGAADDATRARLDTERGVLAAIRGDFSDAQSSGRAILANPAASPKSRAAAYVSLALARAMTGDCDGVYALLDDAYAAARATRVELPLAAEQIGVMHLCALCASGRVIEAVELSDAGMARTAGSAMESTWCSSSVMALDLAGRLQDGAATAATAASMMASSDPFGLEAQVCGLRALERGQLGDQQSGDDIDGLEVDADNPRVAIWVERGAAWSAAARGDVERAAKRAARSGRRAIEQQHVAWGALLLHDAVRLGAPELVIDDLPNVRNDTGAHLMNAMARHGEALAARDGGGLLDASRQFADMGASLLAAEAAAQAAAVLSGREAVRAAALSVGWQLRCQEPRTPALRLRLALVTPREVEVAMDAAGGRTSAEIAERLFLSRRTVDNHLRSAYRKLGVSGRDELPATLAPLLETS